MWPNNVSTRLLGTALTWVSIFVVCVVAWSVYLFSTADSARLHPASREIVVRQVENGYVVEARVQRNPYPYREMVFTRPDDVGAAVAGLLNEAVPNPLWGK